MKMNPFGSGVLADAASRKDWSLPSSRMRRTASFAVPKANMASSCSLQLHMQWSGFAAAPHRRAAHGSPKVLTYIETAVLIVDVIEALACHPHGGSRLCSRHTEGVAQVQGGRLTTNLLEAPGRSATAESPYALLLVVGEAVPLFVFDQVVGQELAEKSAP